MSKPAESDPLCALVVHPSLTVRKDIAEGLASQDIEVAEATTLREALELVSEGFLSIVISALELPDGGIEPLIEAFRGPSGRLETPFVVLCELAQELRAPYDELLFAVSMPYDLTELTTLAAQVAPARPAGGTLCEDTPVRVLAIEDSETYLGALTEALQAEELEVLTATAAEKALSVLRGSKVDCILLDLTLPGMSGQELCRRLRRDPRYRRTPIIMLTAAEEPSAMLAGLQAGADDFIAKSADFEVVRARLRVQLRRQRLEEENRRAKERALHLEQQRRVNEILAREGERLRLAMECADLGGWEWDLSQPMISPTGASRRLFGLEEGTEAVSLRQILRAIHPDYRRRLYGLFDTAASDIEAGIELRLVEGIGSRWLLVRGNTTELPDGSRRLFGIVGDVTARKRREEEERVLNELQSHFMSIVGHDLRSPLSAIVTASTVLEASIDLSGPPEKMLGIIKSSTMRAVRLIETLLDYSKARFGGGIPIAARLESLHEALQPVIHEARVAHPEREIVFEAEGSGLALLDPDRVAQIASNLLANAITHGDPERPITVVSRIGPRWLEVEVKNHGNTIPAEVMPGLFEPFRRASSSPGGLGLGLYIVRSIAEAHGGRVTVVSSQEQGTLFQVQLPRSEGADENASP